MFAEDRIVDRTTIVSEGTKGRHVAVATQNVQITCQTTKQR